MAAPFSDWACAEVLGQTAPLNIEKDATRCVSTRPGFHAAAATFSGEWRLSKTSKPLGQLMADPHHVRFSSTTLGIRAFWAPTSDDNCGSRVGADSCRFSRTWQAGAALRLNFPEPRPALACRSRGLCRVRPGEELFPSGSSESPSRDRRVRLTLDMVTKEATPPEDVQQLQQVDDSQPAEGIGVPAPVQQSPSQPVEVEPSSNLGTGQAEGPGELPEVLDTAGSKAADREVVRLQARAALLEAAAAGRLTAARQECQTAALPSARAQSATQTASASTSGASIKEEAHRQLDSGAGHLAAARPPQTLGGRPERWVVVTSVRHEAALKGSWFLPGNSCAFGSAAGVSSASRSVPEVQPGTAKGALAVLSSASAELLPCDRPLLKKQRSCSLAGSQTLPALAPGSGMRREVHGLSKGRSQKRKHLSKVCPIVTIVEHHHVHRHVHRHHHEVLDDSAETVPGRAAQLPAVPLPSVQLPAVQLGRNPAHSANANSAGCGLEDAARQPQTLQWGCDLPALRSQLPRKSPASQARHLLPAASTVERLPPAAC